MTNSISPSFTTLAVEPYTSYSQDNGDSRVCSICQCDIEPPPTSFFKRMFYTPPYGHKNEQSSEKAPPTPEKKDLPKIVHLCHAPCWEKHAKFPTRRHKKVNYNFVDCPECRKPLEISQRITTCLKKLLPTIVAMAAASTAAIVLTSEELTTENIVMGLAGPTIGSCLGVVILRLFKKDDRFAIATGLAGTVFATTMMELPTKNIVTATVITNIAAIVLRVFPWMANALRSVLTQSTPLHQPGMNLSNDEIAAAIRKIEIQQEKYHIAKELKATLSLTGGISVAAIFGASQPTMALIALGQSLGADPVISSIPIPFIEPSLKRALLMWVPSRFGATFMPLIIKPILATAQLTTQFVAQAIRNFKQRS